MSDRMPENDNKSRYIARRFIPALVLALVVNMSVLFIDYTKIHWAGAISGGLLAVCLYYIKTMAERKFP